MELKVKQIKQLLIKIQEDKIAQLVGQQCFWELAKMESVHNQIFF